MLPEILDAGIELIRFQLWVNGLSLAFSGLGLPALYLTFVSLSPPEASRFYYLYLWTRFAAIGLWASHLVSKLIAYHEGTP